MPTTNKKPGQSRPIYVIAGKDEFLVEAEFQNLLDNLIAREERAGAIFTPDLDKTPLSEILDELRTPALFGPVRIVVVKEAEDFITNNRTILEKYFDRPSRGGILILTVKSWRSNTNLAKKLPKIGQLLIAQDITPRQMPRYITQYASRKHGKNLSPPAAELLVELVGYNLGKLCGEVEKLALFAESEKTITPNHVEQLIGHNRLFNAFEVIDAMTKGNTTAAAERLRKMFSADKDAPYRTVGAFAYHFRRMFSAAALLKKGSSPAQAAGQLGIWRDKDGFFGQVRSLGLEKIGFALADLARIDYEIKTGQATPDVAIEQFIFKLAS